jgi:hypothetical protein
VTASLASVRSDRTDTRRSTCARPVPTTCERTALPDNPILHAAALASVPDDMVVSSAQVLNGPAPADSTVVTFDHAV